MICGGCQLAGTPRGVHATLIPVAGPSVERVRVFVVPTYIFSFAGPQPERARVEALQESRWRGEGPPA